MSRLAKAMLAGAGALVLAAAIAAFGYRAGKLAVLEPRPLATPLVWSGQSDARCTLLMIGDSHVARWQTPPPRGWRVARLGFPGEAAVNIAAAAPAAIRSARPDAVLIAAGTNDASAAALQRSGREATLLRAAAAIDEMIVSARRAEVGRVVVATIAPPRSPGLWRRLVYGDRQAAAQHALSARIAALASVRGVRILDAAALALDARGRVDPRLRADALHWSPAGYEVLSAALWDRLPTCQ